MPVADISGAVSVFFAGTGATAATSTVSEFVISFRKAKAAKSAFAVEARSATAGAKCGTVGFVPPGTSTPISMVKLATLKFPKVGAASFASSITPTGGLTLTTVTFLRGSYIVIIDIPGTADALAPKDQLTIATRADKRLSS